MSMTSNPFAPQGEVLKWDTHGQTHTFTVVEWRQEMGTKYGTTEPEERTVLLVTMADGSARKIYCKPGQLSAIGQAMREAGHDGAPETGAKMALTWTGEAQTKSGFTMHTYEARYQNPDGGVEAAGPFSEKPPATTMPAAPPVAAPATVTATGGVKAPSDDQAIADFFSTE